VNPKMVFLVVPLYVLAAKVQLVVLESASVMISTVWSVACLLFFYSRSGDGNASCPPKYGGDFVA